VSIARIDEQQGDEKAGEDKEEIDAEAARPHGGEK